jgi:hypothetical protein
MKRVGSLHLQTSEKIDDEFESRVVVTSDGVSHDPDVIAEDIRCANGRRDEPMPRSSL